MFGHRDAILIWDLDRPPLEALPHRELLARLRRLTNFRVVPDETTTSGLRVAPDLSTPRGWATPPEW